MLKLTKFFLERKMWGDLVVIALIFLGITAVLQSRKEGFPELSLNKVQILTVYPGASAEDVEIDITLKIEEKLKEVENIKEVISYSEDGVSRILVQGLENLSPQTFRRLFTDIDNAVAATDDLPPTISGRPVIDEITSADSPVYELAYTGDYTKLKPYLEDLATRLRKIKGIAGVDLVGVPDEEIVILIDASKAKNARIGIQQIAASIEGRNINGSGGSITTVEGERQISLYSKFSQYREVLETPIISNDLGFGVKLRDIARIERRPIDQKMLVRNNGKRGAFLAIRKNGPADLLETTDRVQHLISNEKLPPGVEQIALFDQSKLTRDRISLLVSNAVMGFILVFAVLTFFLNYRAAFWAGVGIPLTLLGMLIVLKLLDISINLISLGGFIIILGMLVDDAVVITEEFITNRGKGLPLKEAALLAVQRMWPPVVASSTTTMIAFAPLFAVGGFPGAFIWTIPLMVIVGLLFSLAESFFLLPSHLAHSKVDAAEENKLMKRLEMLYLKTLHVVLHHKFKTLTAFIVLTIISMLLLMNFIRKDPFPQDSAESFSVSLEFPAGSTSEHSEKILELVENEIQTVAAGDLAGISSRVGTNAEATTLDRGTQNNLAISFIYLTPYNTRQRTADLIISELDEKISRLAVTHKFTYSLNLNRIGPPMGKDIEIRVISNDDAKRLIAENHIKKYLSSLEGVSGVTSDRMVGTPQIIVQPNHDRLAVTGLKADELLTAIRMAIDGVQITEIYENNTELPFRIKVETPLNRSLINMLAVNSTKSLPIANPQGNIINLDTLVTLREKETEASITHIDSVRMTSVYAKIDTKKTSPLEVMKLAQKDLPEFESVKIEYDGQPVETVTIFGDLSFAGLLAVLGIYLVIALIFNSYTRPLVVMLSLPFMVVGIAFALVVHNIPGSMMVGIATVGLMGVIVNASIVLVDTIYSLAENGRPTVLNIIEGARSRLRPVFLTVSTTVLGVLPTGYGIGGFDPFLSHMSLVLAYGLLFATLIILIVVPVMLSLFKQIPTPQKEV